MRQALFHLFVSIMLVVRIAHILKEGVAVRRHIFTEHIVISVINVPTTAQVAIEKLL